MKRLILLFLAGGLFAACAGEPPALPYLAQRTAERYLSAWQAGRWGDIYRLEDRSPNEQSILHEALTDSLEFYAISEVRYADRAVACALTLRWRTDAGTYSESGELYLERRQADWFVTGYRSF